MRFETHAKMKLLALLVMVVLSLLLSASHPTSAQDNAGPYAKRIACGSPTEKYSSNGYVWEKDQGYTGGSSAILAVHNPKAPQLNTLRYFQKSDGLENCYNITAPVGRYLIRLFFAFGEADNAGREPQFDVSIEGTLVYRMDTGWSEDPEDSYQDSLVFVDDGAATICFHSSDHGNPAVASIEILQILDDAYNRGVSRDRNIIMKTMKRVSAGARKSGFGSDFRADPWAGDRYWQTDSSLFLPGSRVNSISTTQNIGKFSVLPNLYPMDIFQSATITTDDMQSLSYTLPVDTNMRYSIWIYLAEISPFVVRPQDRVFDILVNKKKVFTGVDIVAQAPGAFNALILNVTVTVDVPSLALTFSPIFGPIAVNAFEIYQLVPTDATTVKTDLWAMQLLKQSLSLPASHGWNGDPCVPQGHTWFGVNCQFNATKNSWCIHGLYLDVQGVRGVLGEEIGSFSGIQVLNISHNTLQGSIPVSIGNLSSLVILDLSHNQLNGSVPETLGTLPNLKKLLLNDNQLSGEVPSTLGASALRGANLNFANNDELCGVGLRPCVSTSNRKSAALRVTAFVVVLVIALMAGCGFIIWKRRSNMARAQKLARGAPYAKARTTFVRDVQMARTVLTDHFRPVHRDPGPYVPSQSSTLLGSS
ncbi:hypothetical protein KC19_7G034400 [Ceratodon purpureus]|uniref:Malectin-like domain-containing protein n=1 Tax=Ceratodon purpureus TaxID=3225 RepID=A0A8T0H428_CERPU|nr:hypothetical protein KC19_7G034400 [Ceratodon purpureus]